jgi:hypothetical protein
MDLAGRHGGGNSRDDYEQDVAIILTSSTFSFGAFDEDEVAADEVAVDEVEPMLLLSTVPVTSTLWPTCGVSFASLASSRYSFAAAERLAVPEVPVVLVALLLLLPVVTLARMNFVSFAVEPVVGVVPVVPVGAAVARCTQPVTVILSAAALLDDCGGGGCWASSPVHAIETNVAVNNLALIVPPALSFGETSATVRPYRAARYSTQLRVRCT